MLHIILDFLILKKAGLGISTAHHPHGPQYEGPDVWFCVFFATSSGRATSKICLFTC